MDERVVDKNKQIEKQLEGDKKTGLPFRLLLLGAGESGKSTFAKQVKFIYANGFTNEERRIFINAIHANVYASMRALIQACRTFNIEVDVVPDALAKFDADSFYSGSGTTMTPDWGEVISDIWYRPCIQKAYLRRSEFQLNDSAKYFLDDARRVASATFVPTNTDILNCRVQTTGVIETTFSLDNQKFVLVDVGGQRSERKKWIHCFEDVTAVLFCVGLSEFDQVLYEDGTTNRMHEALKLFHEIAISKWFNNVGLIIFLNKSDLFREKLLAGKKLSVCWQDFKGPDTFEDTIRFIDAKFKDVPGRATKGDIVSHITCATDVHIVRKVFMAVKASLLAQAMRMTGMSEYDMM